MPNVTIITVTAPAGRATPLHREDGVVPGGALLIVLPGSRHRVPLSANIRRAIARGDLERVAETMDGETAPSANLKDGAA